MLIPDLVAHRGDSKYYPENTFPAIHAALQAGACYIEFDVQLSRDGTPFIIHDANLQRTAGINQSILEMTAEQLEAIYVDESQRLKNQFSHTPIPKLSDIVELISRWPKTKAFVEIKRASLRQFGVEFVLNHIAGHLKAALQQCVIISFDHTVLEKARYLGTPSIGWVLESWNEQSHSIAEKLKPDFLFIDHELIPTDGPLWEGTWRWVAYEINDPAKALQLAERGIHMIETNAIGEMLQHPEFSKTKCS
jgi:glycerophosphoryl diester phosphodiesterase